MNDKTILKPKTKFEMEKGKYKGDSCPSVRNTVINSVEPFCIFFDVDCINIAFYIK